MSSVLTTVNNVVQEIFGNLKQQSKDAPHHHSTPTKDNKASFTSLEAHEFSPAANVASGRGIPLRRPGEKQKMFKTQHGAGKKKRQASRRNNPKCHKKSAIHGGRSCAYFTPLWTQI